MEKKLINLPKHFYLFKKDEMKLNQQQDTKFLEYSLWKLSPQENGQQPAIITNLNMHGGYTKQFTQAFGKQFIGISIINLN